MTVGGPLSVDMDRNLKVQIGVVSWGPGCAQRDTVGVYASVSHFEAWIREHVPEALFYDEVRPSLPSSQATNRPSGSPTASAQALEQEAQAVGSNNGLRVTLVEGTTVHVGNHIHVEVSSSLAGQLLMYNVDQGTGVVYQIFPNDYTKSISVLSPGSKVAVPGPDDDFTIDVSSPFGHNRVYAFVVPPGDAVRAVAARGMDMKSLPDPKGLVEDLDRALVVVPKSHSAVDRASAVLDYEIIQ